LLPLLFAGYGGISPRTQWGRVAALVYALFGIPIVLLYLSAMGEALSAGMRCLFRRQRIKGGPGGGPSAPGGLGSGAGTSSSGVGGGSSARKSDKGKGQGQNQGHYGHQKLHQYGLPPSVYQQQQQQAQQQAQQQEQHRQQQQQGKKSSGGRNGSGSRGSPSVPISICVCVLLCYVSSGAILFHKLQNWSVLESLYFCFTSLGTIGFGELAPNGPLALYTASAYILVGMAVVAMCFSLIQTEIVLWLRRFSVQDHVMPKAEELALVSVSRPSADPALGVGVGVGMGVGLGGGGGVGVAGGLPAQHQTMFFGPAHTLTQYSSLPRRSHLQAANAHGGSAFQRNTPIRRSTGIPEHHLEYFVPRSISEFNLSGVGDLALPPPRRYSPNMGGVSAGGAMNMNMGMGMGMGMNMGMGMGLPHGLQLGPPQTLICSAAAAEQQQQQPAPPPPAQLQIVSLKPRSEKMVTFEDESKSAGGGACPHGVPTTPRKSPASAAASAAVNGCDIFM
ncbi:hypothetical protein KR059_003027, partial [Drosophila kikkawai]